VLPVFDDIAILAWEVAMLAKPLLCYQLWG